MERDHVFFKELRADGTPVANFEGSLIMGEEELVAIRNNMLARGLIGQSASNKNADGEEYKRFPLREICGMEIIKKSFGRRVTVLKLEDGNELRIRFWHADQSIPRMEEILRRAREQSDPEEKT